MAKRREEANGGTLGRGLKSVKAGERVSQSVNVTPIARNAAEAQSLTGDGAMLSADALLGIRLGLRRDLGKLLPSKQAAAVVARFKENYDAVVKSQSSYSATAQFVVSLRSSGSPQLHKAISELNRLVHDEHDLTWRIAALMAVAEMGQGEWWSGITGYLRLPPEGRVEFLEQLSIPEAKFEPIVLMSVLREMVRARSDVEGRALFLRAAGTGMTLALPAPTHPLTGLQGLVAAVRDDRMLYPVSGLDVRSLATRLAAELTADADALKRFRWCRATACMGPDHGCNRNAATGGGPFYLDRARRPDRPSIACCEKHTLAVSRAGKRAKRRRPRKRGRGARNPGEAGRAARPT